MNQILVTEKIYVTPELKRKKKIYYIYILQWMIIQVLMRKQKKDIVKCL